MTYAGMSLMHQQCPLEVRDLYTARDRSMHSNACSKPVNSMTVHHQCAINVHLMLVPTRVIELHAPLDQYIHYHAHLKPVNSMTVRH